MPVGAGNDDTKTNNDGYVTCNNVIPDRIGYLNRKVMENKFDYTKAIEELEAIAAKVEDPKTGIDDIDKYIKRSEELVAACREYLRGAREKLDALQ